MAKKKQSPATGKYLADKVLAVLTDDTKRPTTLSAIAKQAQLPYPYVKLLARGVVREPSSRRIEDLAAALRVIKPGIL